jgi:hypothetical protein
VSSFVLGLLAIPLFGILMPAVLAIFLGTRADVKPNWVLLVWVSPLPASGWG